MNEQELQEIWENKLRALNGVMPLDSIIICAMQEAIKEAQTKQYNIANDGGESKQYFGLCDVEGCKQITVTGGGCWNDTGYWTVCSHHAEECWRGKPQPPMKQWAIDREKKRGADGVLVNEG